MAEKVEDLLAQARALLPRRPSPAEALAAQANGALLIDLRGDDQRRAGGLISGAIVVPRNVLECWSAMRGFSRAWPPRPCNGLACATQPILMGALLPGGRLACR